MKADTPDFDLKGELDRIVKEVYEGKIQDGDVDGRIAHKVATTVSQAISEGYSQKYYQVEWGSPDWEMIRNLQQNVYQFSFAKSYQQMKATTNALFDNTGKVVPFNEFKSVAGRINNEFNDKYLRVEYDHTIGAAQMASRWVQFNAEKDIFPNIKYVTVGDERVRDSHRVLDGTVWSLSDPNLDLVYPPKGWGCRCDAQQTDALVTKPESIIYPHDTPKMFQTNLAKNGLIFPEGHPYFTHLPNEVIKAADNQNPYLYEKIHAGKEGGYVYDNPVHNHGEGWDEQLKTAKILADSGERVILFPQVNNDSSWQKELRKLVLPEEVKEGKNPDARVDGKIMDLKFTDANTKNAIDSLLRNAKDHADTVCIRLTAEMNDADLKSAIKGRVLRTDLQEVWIIKEGSNKPVKYTRSDIEGFK